MSADLNLTKLLMGDNADTSKNIVISVPSPQDGTFTITRGNGTAVLSVDTAGNITSAGKIVVPAQSMVRLNTANGYGSTNTKIRRFTNVVTNQGTDISYADSATLGASFTVNSAGIYAVSYSDSFNTNGTVGISRDTTQPTVSVYDLTNPSETLAISAAPSATYHASTATTIYLSTGSVIRAHTDGAPSGTRLAYFTMVKVA